MMLQMSVSRPASQAGLPGRLPEIVHPLHRAGNPSQLGVRGVSRGGCPGEQPPSTACSYRMPSTAGSQRPLASETDYRLTKRALRTPAGRQADRKSPLSARDCETIPEGVEVTQGDPAKTRIPIFGSRAGGASRGGESSRARSRLANDSAQLRLDTDELEMLLREKMKTGFTEYRKHFRDNDPEQKGNVSREALQRILQSSLGRPLAGSQLKRLLQRLGLQDAAVISFAQFYSAARHPTDQAGTPRWLDPVSRPQRPLSAAHVHGQLRQKATDGDPDLFGLVTSPGSGTQVRVLKEEFRGILNRMGFIMEDDEFDKLWRKFDREGAGNVNSNTMMKILGMTGASANGKRAHVTDVPVHRPTDLPDIVSKSYDHLPVKEAERQRSLDIERWLKNKFRKGIFTMKDAFRKYDQQNTGQVTHDNFLTILSEFGLKLEKTDLAAFLARCGVKPTNTHVDYFEFIFRFQDRGETGLPHAILTNAKHRYNAAESVAGNSTFSAIEVKLMNLFQKDFLSLLGMFHKIDRLGRNLISQEEFRALIESRFGLEMTDEQFRSMLERLPLDTDGMVKYADFMAQLDTKGKAGSLFNELGRLQSAPVACPHPRDEPTSPRLDDVIEEEEGPQFDRLVVQPPPDDQFMVDMVTRRPTSELFKLIKDVMKQDFQAVEAEFMELDEKNSRRMSQDMMYNLLKRLKVAPEVTRGEIRDLWKTFITNMDKSLDFHEFTRHFGYSLKSAAFPNAKVSPPKKGDSDMRMRSRKLNCAADMLQDALRSKIGYMCGELQAEFDSMDPYNTGCVSHEEYREVLQELCVHLNEYELEMLSNKFRTADDRISYREFLKPFVSRKEVWRCGNNMTVIMRHSEPRQSLARSPPPALAEDFARLTLKLKQQLKSDWKTMRRAFRKADVHRAGFLPLPELRAVLKAKGVELDEEEVYCILSELDDGVTGRVQYHKLLSAVYLPRGGRPSALRRSAVF